MNLSQRWAKLRDRSATYLSPEARREFSYRLTLWDELRRRQATALAPVRHVLEDWLSLHLDWWESLWGNERQSLAHLDLKAMGIDPRAPLARQKRDVLAYFQTRVFPPDTESGWPQAPTAKLIQNADLVCRHVFTFLDNPPHCLGPSLDWNANPFFDIEWPTCLQRHIAWIDLARAYQATRQERYVREWITQGIDWVARNPIQPWSHCTYAWSTLNAAIRAIVWSRLIPAMVRSPVLTADNLLLFLGALRRNMNFLMTHAAQKGNWLLYESEGLVRIGAVIHEFKRAPAWRREGCRRLNHEIRRQVLPDGAHIEMCPGYHAGIVRSFHAPLILARRYGFDLPFAAVYRKRLRQAFRFFAFTAKPDGLALPVGDTHSKVDIRPLAFQGAQEFNDPELLFAATGGRQGRPPASSCLLFRNSGHIVMRDDWRSARRFLLFDVAPHGGWHSHQDSLQVILWAFGQDLLADSGCYRYSNPDHVEYGKTWRHNTITVDEQSQDMSRPALTGWQTRADFAYAAGLSRPWAGVRHLREVMFIRSTFWLVLDLLVSDQPHVFQQWWHFGQSRVSAGRNRQYRTPNLLLVSAGADSLRLQSGEVVSYNKKWVRPVLRAEQRGHGLVGFATLLYPHRKGEAPWAAFTSFKPPLTPEGRFHVAFKTPLGDMTVDCSGSWKQRNVKAPFSAQCGSGRPAR